MLKNINAYILIGCLFLMTCAVGCKKESGGNGHNAGEPIVINEFLPVQGGGGTEVLFTGSNYINDTNQVTVTLNGKPLKVVGVNGSQIMAVVPKKAGSGHFVVKIGDDSVVSTGIFNYVYTRTVSTFAGGNTAGFANGKGTDAMFNLGGANWYRSMGIVVDDKLNVFVADPGNHCIRKIDSNANVTTFSGTAVSGYADGKGTAARFSLPYDLALDASGNLWCADPGNWDIRKIEPDGTATTWAWGSEAPWSVAFDKITGKVYWAGCSSPGSIYPINGQWSVGTPILTGLNYPAGFKFDNSGNLYVSMHGDNMIKKYKAATWTLAATAGSGVVGYANGAPSVAKFANPWGLAVDAGGNVYVATNGTWDGSVTNADQAIRYIDGATFNVSTFAGSSSAGYADAVGEAAAFSAPTGVAVDKNGTVYVLDKNNNRIRKIISE
ncbi:IPT/TIG domain-containing protein [Niastella sp. OAS944]|uniref:IPT/TIG domain-containing protein n=1 Tax=Niastella sp. OAS944 TaxID=2664089 RepID=UPI003473C430|nr:sugar lactone lactonase YvrE [Chitinophagaceae bacterium OAS944]